MNDLKNFKEKVTGKKEQLEGQMQGGVKGGLREMKGKAREEIANTRDKFDGDDVV